MVKATRNKETGWSQRSKTFRGFSFSRPAVQLDNHPEESELSRNPGEMTNQTYVLKENEETQEQSESKPKTGNQKFIEVVGLIMHRAIGYCRGKELFIVGFAFLCIQLILLKKYQHEYNTEELSGVINKLIAENEQFKMEVLAKIKDIDGASNLHKDKKADDSAVVKGLPGFISIPIAYPIYGGLVPGMVFYISGRPSSNPIRFTLNFQSRLSTDPPPDVAFHFDVRFSSRTIVRNSRKDNVWGKEEAFTTNFPFKSAVNFDMIIRVERNSNRFVVELNGESNNEVEWRVEFKHRLRPLSLFDTLCIKGDILISSISHSTPL